MLNKLVVLLLLVLLLVKLPPLLPITVLPLNEPSVSLDVVLVVTDEGNILPQLVLCCLRFLCLLRGDGVLEYCSSDRLRDEDANNLTPSISVGDDILCPELFCSDSSSSLI